METIIVSNEFLVLLNVILSIYLLFLVLNVFHYFNIKFFNIKWNFYEFDINWIYDINWI